MSDPAPAHPDAPAPGPVLVTGGAGFIGRHVVARLRRDGHAVTVADHHPHPDPGVRSVTGELRDPAVLDQAVDGVAAIVHLAAMTSVLGSIERPVEIHQVNVDVTAALLDLARVREVEAFVLASSNAVTGNVGDQTITEEMPLAPLTPYGATKAAAEMLASGYAGAYGLRAPMLRFSNVYGPGMRHKDSLIPRLMRAAAAGGSVEVYGTGEQRRDLVHVGDIAEAVALAARGWPTGPVIVGSGHSPSVNEIIDAAREATGRPIATTAVPAKPGEMPAVIIDIAKARRLGYAPRVGLIDGLRGAWHDFEAATGAQPPQ